MNPVHCFVVRGEKCNVAVGAVVVGGQDYKHKAPLKNKCVAALVFVLVMLDDGGSVAFTQLLSPVVMLRCDSVSS